MSFTFNGATISAREPTIGEWDLIDTKLVTVVLKAYPQALQRTVDGFGAFAYCAEVEGDSPVPHLTAVSPDSEVLSAYERWLTLPRSFAQKWQKELGTVETPAPNG